MLKSTCRFFKNKKIVEPVGHVHFVVFETFSSAYYTKFALEIMAIVVTC